MPFKPNYSLLYTSATLHTPVRRIEDPEVSNPDLDKPVVPISVGNLVDFSDDFISDPILKLPNFYELARHRPLIFTVDGLFAYGALRLTEGFILIGPVRFDTPVYYKHRVSLKDLAITELPEDFNYWIKSIPLTSFESFIAIMLLLVNERKEGTSDSPFYTKDDILAKNCIDEETTAILEAHLTESVFNKREDLFVHNPFNHELRETHCIETGNYEGLRQVLSETFTGRYGKLGFDPIRQEINIGIVTITIASRAAIRGGVHFEEAFYLSDMAIQKMEQCHDVETIKRIYVDAEFHYCSLVNEINQRKAKAGNKTKPDSKQNTGGDQNPAPRVENRNISRCKDYVHAHLHGKLSVAEIANAIGLEANYLSALFKKEEGITLKSYIMKEKMRLVKNLLTYSKYSYTKITYYLGFSSQSHLGREFKKETGMTMKQYRETYAKEDFIKEAAENEGDWE